MKFRVVIEGKAFGFVPIRLTPIDVPVPAGSQASVATFVASVKPHELRFMGFSGSIALAIKTGA